MRLFISPRLQAITIYRNSDMLTDIRRKDIAELYRTPILQQTAFWSIVKRKVGQQSVAMNFKINRRSVFAASEADAWIHSDILVIIRPLSKDACMAYVPYGPELMPDNEFQGMFLEELSECLRPFLPKNCCLIRYDLCWEVYWAKEKSPTVLGDVWGTEPAVRTQEMRLNFRTINWNLRKAYSNNLPTNTMFIDLQPDLETILERMKPKTRYNIRLSQRKGVVVRRGDRRDLPLWYALYTETANRNGIVLNDIRYFEAILTAKSDKTKSPAEVFFLIAELDHQPLAALILVISAHRGSYLYGASSSHHRQVMPAYALQWEAIRISKEKGCKEYDLFGISPGAEQTHQMYGLYRFKNGFGGELFQSLGCWDYPLDQNQYLQFKQLELNNRFLRS